MLNAKTPSAAWRRQWQYPEGQNWPWVKMVPSGAHQHDVIMSMMAPQITGLMIVYSTVYSGTDQRKHQSSASLAFVRGIHRWPVNSPHKGPVTRKMFPFDDVNWHSWYSLIGPIFDNFQKSHKIQCHDSWPPVMRSISLPQFITLTQRMNICGTERVHEHPRYSLNRAIF